MASKLIAIVAGVGPGTSAAVARRFGAAYPIALLARNPDNFNPLVDEINKSGGKAIGVKTDVSSESSVKSALETIKAELGDAGIAAAVFNASGAFSIKPFLELTFEDYDKCFDVSAKGAFLFAQATLPGLLKARDANPTYPPSLIFTGATASLRGSAKMSTFASGKFALRALAQSLAREFDPQGVHVAHTIIDGIIDIPRTKEWMKDAGPDARLKPEAIADTYWHLHTQHRSCFTFEVDVRPFVEKW